LRKRNLPYNLDDTIVAISTAAGEGGIGIVRLSGKKSLSIADKIFLTKSKKKPSKCKTHTLHYGHVAKKRILIDEVILTVMKAPRSYTKEDVVEISCHGGMVALRKVLSLVTSLGARIAKPGEFTKRAFLNGRIDLTQAEAVLDIIKSRTDNSMKISLKHLEGELSREVKKIKNKLLNVLSELEAGIDFSEEDIELESKKTICGKLTKISGDIKKLIDNAWKGMILKEGMLCVITGKPNVGKSSLMNAFLRRNRVIVTPVPGTTRDAIEEVVNLEGIPLRVVDTAGISKAKDVVEEHGIRKSKSYIKAADLILFMLDLSKPWSKADSSILSKIRKKNFIVIANKIDLKRKLDIDKVKKLAGRDSILEVSLLKRKNLDKIEKGILEKIWHGETIQPEGTFVTNIRHKRDLEVSRTHIEKLLKSLTKESKFQPELAAHEVKEAVFFLGSILGDNMDPDILNRIFSRFCIGK